MDDKTRNDLKEWFARAKAWALASAVRALFVGMALGWVLRGVL